MSYPLGTKIRLTKPWRAYSIGAVLEQGYEVDLESLVVLGYAVKVEEIEARPAKLGRKAADKIAQKTRQIFG